MRCLDCVVQCVRESIDTCSYYQPLPLLAREPVLHHAQTGRENSPSSPAFYLTIPLGPVDNQQVQMKAAESATNDENRSESLS
jgi:hypothetical protein